MGQPGRMTDHIAVRTWTLAELAQALGAAVHGDGSIAVRGIDHPARAAADQLALAVDAAALPHLVGTKARTAVVLEDAPAEALAALKGWIAVKRGRVALSVLTRMFARAAPARPGIHPQACVDAAAKVDPAATVEAFAYVGAGARIGARSQVMAHASVGAGASLGSDCLIHPGARVGERVRLGDRVVLHPNCCIGADGFSFVTPEPGTHEIAATNWLQPVTRRNDEILKVHSLGTVVIEDDVEIGACTTVDRATFGATLIRRGTKIDNQVQIAHNCTVGENCLIVGQVGISGSVRIGDRVVLGGQVGVRDHVSIGDDSVIAAGAAVIEDVPPKVLYAGYPAAPAKDVIAERLNIRRLPRLVRDVVEMGRRLTELERRAARPHER